MKTLVKLLIPVAATMMLSACAHHDQPPADYAQLRAAHPRSILVIPATNRSTQVDAADNFLVTLARPLAERGYYVFPTHMVKRTMEDEGLGDADMVHKGDVRRVAALFGADAVLYAEIVNWDASYAIISTTTTVTVNYELKSGLTGATLWKRTITAHYSPQASSGNPLAALIASAITAAIQRAHPNYIPLANLANLRAFSEKDQGLLAGPYDADPGSVPTRAFADQ